MTNPFPFARSAIAPFVALLASALAFPCLQAQGGPIDHFAVGAPSSAFSGVAFNVTVTAEDSSNNTVTTYSGTVNFSSTDSAAVLPPDGGLTNGVGTFSVTLNTLGSWTVTATDPFMSSVTGTSGAINVGVAPPPTPSLYWTDTTTGERVIWLMNGTRFVSSVSLGVMPTEWRIADTGDFLGDGQPDIVWENTSTGDRYIWLMNGTTFSSSV